MKKSIYLIIFILLVKSSQVLATGEGGPVIKGKVTDINGSPLQGTSVTIENTYLGGNTDINGNYALSVFKRGDYTIRFSFIGYEPEIRKLRLRERYGSEHNTFNEVICNRGGSCKCHKSRNQHSNVIFNSFKGSYLSK